MTNFIFFARKVQARWHTYKYVNLLFSLNESVTVKENLFEETCVNGILSFLKVLFTSKIEPELMFLRFTILS